MTKQNQSPSLGDEGANYRQMKRYEPLMLITAQGNAEDIITTTNAFLHGGGRWVQLRLKEGTNQQRVTIGSQLVSLCRNVDAVCIINDSPEIAMACNAHGVHLGKNDMPVSRARALMGNDAIIGGTANTLNDMIHLATEGADYIGLGPFRFTTTKQNLSPVLGLDGYVRLMAQFRRMGYTLPVTAIGGIVPEDVTALMGTGVTGLAVSGIIASHANPQAITTYLIQQIHSTNQTALCEQ